MNRKTPVLASFVLAVALAGAVAGCSRAQPPQGEPRLLANRGIPAASRSAIDRLFADREAMGETRALLILRDGQPIYEAYGPGYGPDSRMLSWSMAKSITAALIGILVADGRLVLDDPAPVPAWQRPGDPRGAITLRHLLHMASGLDHVENGDPVWTSDTVAMLFGGGAQDMAGMAEAKPPVARPDELFNYSTPTSVILSDIIARSLTDSDAPAVRRDAVRSFVDGRLAQPLGMTSLTPEFDPHGTMIGGSIMHATARDYAKFGEFLRLRGRTASGARLLPDSWVQFMLTPSPANAGYGGQIWLNRANGTGKDQGLWSGQGGTDIFACIGHQGQYVIVSPRQKLTVVRLGISTDDQIANVREALRQVVMGL